MSPGPSAAQPNPTVQDDVRLIVSGNFSQDALGPDRYREILARLEAAPQQYLDAFRALVAEAESTGRLSTLHLPWFLTLLARTDPAAARLAATELLGKYQNALGAAKGPQPVPGVAAELRARPAAPASEEDKKRDRLQSRTDELQRLLQR